MAQWVPEHTHRAEPDYELQFTGLGGITYSGGSAADVMQRIARLPESDWIALDCPRRARPCDAYHVVQTVAKGLYADGEIDEGPEEMKLRFPRPCDGRHTFTLAGFHPNEVPWPREQTAYAFFNRTGANAVGYQLMIVRNVRVLRVDSRPMRERSRSRDGAVARRSVA